MTIRTFTLVVASTSVHKVREFRAMLKAVPLLDVLSLIDFPGYTAPAEVGMTFEENALLKAEHAAVELQHWVLADDSGLVVPAIGGKPGIYSARFAGNSATDADNRKKLLDTMHHLLDDDRAAYYECCLALASPGGAIRKVVRGTCEGKILLQERGGGGFGYDPLFVKHEYNKSFAELEESIKNRISHRRKAFDKLLPAIESLIQGNECFI
jgi:XTP/dITP diphosphohydrolase